MNLLLWIKRAYLKYLVGKHVRFLAEYDIAFVQNGKFLERTNIFIKGETSDVGPFRICIYKNGPEDRNRNVPPLAVVYREYIRGHGLTYLLDAVTDFRDGEWRHILSRIVSLTKRGIAAAEKQNKNDRFWINDKDIIFNNKEENKHAKSAN